MKYADLSKAHRDLKKVPYDDNDSSKNDDYWAAQEAFKLKLKEAMRNDELLKKLTRPQLLKVCAWCSTYRPLEPHVCLATLGRLAS